MVNVRKPLVRIRRWYLDSPGRLFSWEGILIGLLLLASLGVDYYLPFTSWWNVLRCALMVPLACCLFILEYVVALYLHEYQKENDLSWEAYRLRYSLRWRQRMALMGGAVLIVLIYATGPRVGYTASAGLYVSLAIALVMFVTPTLSERRREELNIPDTRDVEFQKRLKTAQAQRAARSASKKKEKDDA